MYARTILFLLFCATLQIIRVPMLWGIDFVLPALLSAGTAMKRPDLFFYSCIVAGGLAWMRGSVDWQIMIYIFVPLLVHRNTITYALLRDYYLLLCVIVCMFVLPLTAVLTGQDLGIAMITGIKNAAAGFVLMTVYLFVILPRGSSYSRTHGYTESML